MTSRLDWEQAASAEDLDTLQRMVAAGWDIDATDGYSQTALMRAAHAGQIDTATWLIENNADLNRCAKHNLSALMLAIISGHVHIARLLVAAGADTEIAGTGPPGFKGHTAYDLAQAYGHPSLATYIRYRR
jgi:ankyrin repeat protein